MTAFATVLYEDTMLPGPAGEYPLHDFVMRVIEDEIDGKTWRLRSLVAKNPRKGIGNVLNDVKRTGLIAGAGELYLLVDRDEIADQLGLQAGASDADVVAELKARSDAPQKLHPFFLFPNAEGLLRAIQSCDPELLPANMEAALQKKLNDRDIILNEAKKAARRELRDCVRQAQRGLDALAKAIAATIPREAIA